LEIASCTVPTTDSPDSSTVIPAATTSDGRVPGGSAPTANSASVDPVASSPPVTCWKNAGRPQRVSTRPVRSISAVTTNATSAVSAPAPSSTAIDAASPPHPAVATQRGYGCARRTAVSSASDAALTRSARARSARRSGPVGQPGEVQRPVADQPHRRHRRRRVPAVAAHGDRGEGDVDVHAGQPDAARDPQHRRGRLVGALPAGQQHLPDLHAQVQHLLDVRIGGHLGPDRPQQRRGRRSGVQQAVRLAAQRRAHPPGQPPAPGHRVTGSGRSSGAWRQGRGGEARSGRTAIRALPVQLGGGATA
jgi:hypothetical protein